MKHIVGFSGGIDSQAALRKVREMFGDENVIALNSDAGGNEDPLTIDFTAHFSATVFPVTTVSAINADMWADGSSKPEEYGLDPNGILDFPGLIARKGMPMRKRRTCTMVLKLQPQIRWIKEHFGIGGEFEGLDYERYTGVRRDESHKRSATPDREWDAYFDCWLNHPIAAWTKEQCFAYCQGEPINPLYSMGFNRVGCAPCIVSSKEDIANWQARRPEMLAKIAKWEKTITLPSKTEPGFDWFQHIVPRLKRNSVEDVIDWAQTSRGGRQSLFPILHEREGCESKYGLCE